MNTDKLKQLLRDEKFCERLFDLETPQEVQELLKENSVTLTIEEIDTFKDIFQRYQNDALTEDEKKAIQFFQNRTSDELDDEALETVAGGFGLFTAFVLLCVAACVVTAVPLTDHLTRSRW